MPRLHSPRSPRGAAAVGVGGVGGRLPDGGEAEVLRRIVGRLAGLAERIDEAGGRAWPGHDVLAAELAEELLPAAAGC